MHPGQILTALIDVHWYSQLAHTVEANRRVIGMALHLRPRKSAQGLSFPPPSFSPLPLFLPSRTSTRPSERERFRRENSSRAHIIGGSRVSSTLATFPYRCTKERPIIRDCRRYGRVVAFLEDRTRIGARIGRLPWLGRTRALMTWGARGTQTTALSLMIVRGCGCLGQRGNIFVFYSRGKLRWRDFGLTTPERESFDPKGKFAGSWEGNTVVSYFNSAARFWPAGETFNWPSRCRIISKF